jgi:hypothetical protein
MADQCGPDGKEGYMEVANKIINHLVLVSSFCVLFGGSGKTQSKILINIRKTTNLGRLCLLQ